MTEIVRRWIVATGAVALAVMLLADVAAAQTAAPPPARDSLWNGTLIGLGAGVGSAAALDAVFCENGFGGCDFPWATYLTLGGIGAGSGAAIDFLIGRRPGPRTTTFYIAPLMGQGRKGVVASLVLRPGRSAATRPAEPTTRPSRPTD